MTSADDLDRFQVRLLTGLAAGTPDAVAAHAAPLGDDLRQWVAGWDPDLVALASTLVRQWAVTDAGVLLLADE